MLVFTQPQIKDMRELNNLKGLFPLEFIKLAIIYQIPPYVPIAHSFSCSSRKYFIFLSTNFLYLDVIGLNLVPPTIIGYGFQLMYFLGLGIKSHIYCENIRNSEGITYKNRQFIAQCAFTMPNNQATIKAKIEKKISHFFQNSQNQRTQSIDFNNFVILLKQLYLILTVYCYRNSYNNQMHSDEIHRKTFFRVHDTTNKKKPHHLVKLPSVKLNQPENKEYIMGQLLGEGGFAKVKLCTRKTDNVQVVMKIFQKFKLTTEQKRKNVMRQIDIMKCIKHPSIIRIIDFYETNDTINIVMQHFSRVPLSTYARNHRPLPDHTLRSIIKQIAQAVAYLHRMRIAHRDLKPENVLINEQGEIKVIDMGLSMMGEHSQVKIAGTPYYMSPELVNKKEYDPFKADIWAFGILLYWIVLGYFPQDNQGVKKRKNKFELCFPADMHPGIEYLITQMLKEDPSQRIEAEQILVNTWIQPKDFKNQIFKLMKSISK